MTATHIAMPDPKAIHAHLVSGADEPVTDSWTMPSSSSPGGSRREGGRPALPVRGSPPRRGAATPGEPWWRPGRVPGPGSLR